MAKSVYYGEVRLLPQRRFTISRKAAQLIPHHKTQAINPEIRIPRISATALRLPS